MTDDLFVAMEAGAAIGRFRIVTFSAPASTKGITQAASGARALIGTTGRLGGSVGEMVDVATGGNPYVQLGAAVLAGDPLTSDVLGRAVRAIEGDNVIGIAREPGVADDVIVYRYAPSAYSSGVLQRMKRAASRAAAFNQEDAPLHPTATYTIDQTIDATMTKTVGATALLGLLAFSGGAPTLVSNGARIVMPVSSIFPQSGSNMSAYPAQFPDNNINAWAHHYEFETDAPALQIDIESFLIYGHRLTVDGQLVDTKTFKQPAGNGASFVHVTMGGSRQLRRVRFASSARAALTAIRLPATASIWKPVYDTPFSMIVAADSYGEPANIDQAVMGFVPLLGNLLGCTDARAMAVGSTGYARAGRGAGSNFPGQVSRWKAVNPDLDFGKVALVLTAYGYNDRTLVNDVRAKALEGWRAVRELCPNALIVAAGSQTGLNNNDTLTLQVENNIKAGLADLNDPMSVFLPVSTDASPWMFGTGREGATNGSGNTDFLIGPDAIHPNIAGQNHMARRFNTGIRGILGQM